MAVAVADFMEELGGAFGRQGDAQEQERADNDSGQIGRDPKRGLFGPALENSRDDDDDQCASQCARNM